jgi:3-mercaptopyruvate sulfurtransferase SseA
LKTYAVFPAGSVDEFEGPLGHIDGAINIPADILRACGVHNVKVLRAGMQAWSKG